VADHREHTEVNGTDNNTGMKQKQTRNWLKLLKLSLKFRFLFTICLYIDPEKISSCFYIVTYLYPANKE
jgi:hypothetical protein